MIPPLTEYHNAYDGGLKWRLTSEGVQTEANGILRTPGEPLTIRKIWRDYAATIQDAAETFGVPVEALLATIATESVVRDGIRDPKQVRIESHYKSDELTPDRVSVGLCHLLIGTASRLVGLPVSRGWLGIPRNNIWCAALYIRKTAGMHGFDGPKIGAVYNAGTVAVSDKNRWRMRSTNNHLDRWCSFYGDAVAVIRDAGGCVRDHGWMITAHLHGVL